MKSKLALIETQRNFDDKQTLSNRMNFALQHTSTRSWSAFFSFAHIYQKLAIFKKLLWKHAFNRKF